MTIGRLAFAVVLALALAACGDDGTTPAADARRADAAIVEPPGPITVSVLALPEFDGSPAHPAVGALVAFVGPDGDAAVIATDAAGQATATIAPGTTVFVLRTRSDGSHHLAAYAAIDPGVDLQVGVVPAPFFAPPQIGVARITLPPVPDTMSYTAAMSCSSNLAGSTEPDVFAGIADCPRLEHATVITAAFDFTGTMTAYGVDRNVDLPATFTAPFEVPAVFRPAIAVDAFTSIPPEVASIDVTRRQREDDVTLTSASRTINTDGAVLAITQSIIALGQRSEVRAHFLSTGGSGQVWSWRTFDGLRLSTSTDLGATMLPFMTTPSFSVDSRTAAWTYYGAGGRGADLVAMRGAYVHGVDETIAFTVFCPGDRTHVTLPPLPPELAAAAPRPGSNASLGEHWAVDVIGRGYRDLVGTADLDTQNLFDDRAPAYRDANEVWITGGP